MPPDYEKIAGEVPVGGGEPEKVLSLDEIEEASRVYLPVTHEKYQGLGEQKGYDQSYSRIEKTSYSHDAMIDVIIAEPTISQRALAKRFERSEAWISRIIGSDAFQAALAKRRDDILDPAIVASVDERLNGLVIQSLEIITEKLESSRSVDVAFKGLEIGTKALGFGARGGGGNNQQNNFTIVLPQKAPSSQEWVDEHGMKRAGNG